MDWRKYVSVSPDDLQWSTRSMTSQFHEAAPTIGEFAFRAASDGSPIFEGYASVFNSPSRPITDKWGAGYVETIRPASFKRSLSSGKRHTFVVDHEDSQLISATNSGRLRLAEDSKGLHVESHWPKGVHYAENVRALHDAGEQLAMSFTFRPTRGGDEWNAQRSQHIVTDAVLGHVTVLTWREPAFAETTAGFRALAERMEADLEDIEALFDALKEGRSLNEGEINLLTRLAEDVKPEAGEATEARSQAEEVDPKLTVAYWRAKAAELPTL